MPLAALMKTSSAEAKNSGGRNFLDGGNAEAMRDVEDDASRDPGQDELAEGRRVDDPVLDRVAIRVRAFGDELVVAELVHEKDLVAAGFIGGRARHHAAQEVERFDIAKMLALVGVEDDGYPLRDEALGYGVRGLDEAAQDGPEARLGHVGAGQLASAGPLEVDHGALEARALDHVVGYALELLARARRDDADGRAAALEAIEVLAAQELPAVEYHPGVVDAVAEDVAAVAQAHYRFVRADEPSVVEV